MYAVARPEVSRVTVPAAPGRVEYVLRWPAAIRTVTCSRTSASCGNARRTRESSSAGCQVVAVSPVASTAMAERKMRRVRAVASAMGARCTVRAGSVGDRSAKG